MKPFSLSALSLLSAFIFSSCASCWVGGIPLRNIERAGQKQAAQDFKSATSVQVYRGLAHPITQKNLYRKQLKTTQFVKMHDFEFLKQPITLTNPTLLQIQNLYADPNSHQALSTKDLCSFHPDYAFVWKKNGQTRELQICYGCHEWRYYGPIGEFPKGIVRTDINEPAYFDHLIKILPQKP